MDCKTRLLGRLNGGSRAICNTALCHRGFSRRARAVCPLMPADLCSESLQQVLACPEQQAFKGHVPCATGGIAQDCSQAD